MLKTAQKIVLAKAAYHTLMVGRRLFGLSPEVLVTRGGLRWRLDLREGIDLSIYLLGGFELATLRLYRRLVKPGDTVLDIGANIGAHTLPLAQLVGNKGRVIAFEPTRFAVDKLITNINLNPNIATRIAVSQSMLSSGMEGSLSPALYSSWPLVEVVDVHGKHRGQLMDTTGARLYSLDQAIIGLGVDKVDFIKLDVDGNEYSVLCGGINTLKRFKPLILIEIAPYLYKQEDFISMLTIFKSLNYCFHDIKSNAILPLELNELRRLIPQGAGQNIIARSGDLLS